jgi:hypothetical protein
MTPSEALRRIGEHLLTDGALPTLVWPNQALPPTLPRIEIQYVPVSRADPTIKGGGVLQVRGFVIATVVTASGTMTSEAIEVVERLLQLFPKGLDLDGLRISGAAEDLPGFDDRDGAEWRQPVRIPFEGSGTPV